MPNFVSAILKLMRMVQGHLLHRQLRLGLLLLGLVLLGGAEWQLLLGELLRLVLLGGLLSLVLVGQLQQLVLVSPLALRPLP